MEALVTAVKVKYSVACSGVFDLIEYGGNGYLTEKL